MSTFTYNSVGLIINHLESRSQDRIDHFLELHGLTEDYIRSFNRSSKLTMLRGVFKALLSKEDVGILKRITESVLSEIQSPSKEQLETTLKADGFTITNRALQVGPIEVLKERTALQVLIERNPSLSRETLLHHLEQCEDIYREGKWDASIGQGRNFIEQLLLDIANHQAKRRGEAPDLSKPVLVRNYLVASTFLGDNERKKLVDGIYGYLSEEGSHPGISEQRIAHISRILCLTIGQYLIEKLEKLT